MKRILAVLTLALCATAMAQDRVPAAPQPNDDEILMAQAGPAPSALPTPDPEMQGPEGPGPGQHFKQRGPEGGPDGMGGPRMKSSMRFWNNSEIATKLNLTDEQKQQLETNYTNTRLKLIDQQAAVERESVKLEPLVNADKIDEGALTKQVDALIAARGQLERTRMLMLFDIRKVLTADQWKQLRDMRHEMMRMHHEGPEARGQMRQFRRMPRPDGATPQPAPQPNPQNN